MISIKIAAHLVLCTILLATVLARLVRTDERTVEAITFGFWVLAMAAAVGLIAPWAHHMWPEFGRFRVHWSTLLMELGIVLVQVNTARHWRTEVPWQFQKDGCLP